MESLISLIERKRRCRLLRCPIDWPIDAIATENKTALAILELQDEIFPLPKFVALNAERINGALIFRKYLWPTTIRQFKYSLIARYEGEIYSMDLCNGDQYPLGIIKGRACRIVPSSHLHKVRNW